MRLDFHQPSLLHIGGVHGKLMIFLALIRNHIEFASSAIENVLSGLFSHPDSQMWSECRCPDNQGSTVHVVSMH